MTIKLPLCKTGLDFAFYNESPRIVIVNPSIRQAAALGLVLIPHFFFARELLLHNLQIVRNFVGATRHPPNKSMKQTTVSL